LHDVLLWQREHPYLATMVSQYSLTAPDSSKDVRHIEIDLGDSGITYQPGDSLGIWINNDPGLVNEICTLCKLDANAEVLVDTKMMPLGIALREYFELTQLYPGFIKHYADVCQSPELLALAGNTPALRKYLDHRQIAEVLHQFPCTLSAQQLLGCLRKLTPRQYSIASSQRWNEAMAATTSPIDGKLTPAPGASDVSKSNLVLDRALTSAVGETSTPGASDANKSRPTNVFTAKPNLVALTVKMVRYTEGEQERKGAGSSFLGWRLRPGNKLPVFVIPNPNFRLPESSDTPIIMIGPGTGIAPFRAFLQERAALKSQGKNWLFFGNAERGKDFLYEAELSQWLQTGLLSCLDVAFSRDQEAKIYVQHRMLEHASKLYEWLQQGAHVYVCGDAKHMAEDVQKALLQIIEQQGHLDAASARQVLVKMRQEKRYQRDVY
jgi:sulfite reductase (NADPH) flavoprotein alpha-component